MIDVLDTLSHWIWIFVGLAVWGVVGGAIAERFRGRFGEGFFWCFVLGPFGLIAVAMMTDTRRRCPNCGGVLHSETIRICPLCGRHAPVRVVTGKVTPISVRDGFDQLPPYEDPPIIVDGPPKPIDDVLDWIGPPPPKPPALIVIFCVACCCATAAGAEPAMLKDFADRSIAASKERQVAIQKEMAALKGKSPSKYNRSQIQKLGSELRALGKGSIVPAAIGNTQGSVGAAPGIVAVMTKSISDDSAEVDLYYLKKVPFEIPNMPVVGNLYESRSATRGPGQPDATVLRSFPAILQIPGASIQSLRKQISGNALARGVTHGIPVPAVVELVSDKAGVPVYRAITYDELKPYLKSKSIIGLDKPKPSKAP